MQDNKKAGQLSLERLAYHPETTDPVEMQQAMMKEFCDNVMEAAIAGSKVYKGPFYVVVLTKRERLMENIFRFYYFHRSTCPTPTYDQTVYRFDHGAQEVTEIWNLPDMDTCHEFYNYPLEVPADERCLLDYVIDFFSGKLLNIAKTLNGENATDIPVILSLHSSNEELLCPKN